MGGPSAAIVAAELIDLGARRLLRVGTCGALDPSLELGGLLIASEALAEDGTSRALGASERVRADPLMVQALTRAGEASGAAGAGSCPTGERLGDRIRTGIVVSTDLFYDTRGLEPAWAAGGALAAEMECAALFTFAASRGVSAGAALVISDALTFVPGMREPRRRRIEPEALYQAELRLGRLAADALALQPSSPSQ
jgi:uridine phosphorylase